MTATTPNAGLGGRGEVLTQLVPTMQMQKPKRKYYWMQRKNRKKKNKQKRENNNINNNQTIYQGFITDSIMEGVTISLGLTRQMTSDFRNFRKSGAAHTVAKDYEHWPGIINLLEPIKEKQWKTAYPNKSICIKTSEQGHM